ncbi:MAG: extracellular solute-binding protein [Oscillospiraceae bacterium]|nr:extracellular solute-binding protein [Oscillospiraceae bacterium]
MKFNWFMKFFPLFLFYLALSCLCGCDFTEDSKDNVDPNDFNLPVRNQEYDFLLYNSFYEQEDDFDNICKEYELQTGVKVKNFSVKSRQDYISALKFQIESNDKPSIFVARNTDELLLWEKEGAALDLSLDLDGDFKDFTKDIDENLLLTSNDINNFGIPCGIDFSGYFIDVRIINDLVGEEKSQQFLEDFRLCSYEEFKNFVKTFSSYIEIPQRITITLNKTKYELKNEKGDRIRGMTEVFSVRNKPENFVDSVFSQTFDSPLKFCRASYQQIDFLKDSIISYLKLLEIETSYTNKKRGQELSDEMSKETQSNDSLTDFLQGKSLFLQGGNDDLNKVEKISPGSLKYIRILPRKISYPKDDIKSYNSNLSNFNTSFFTFANSYFIVNSKVSKREQKFAQDFLIWFNTSKEGKNFIVDRIKKIPAFIKEKADIGLLGKLFSNYDSKNIFHGVSFGTPESWREEISKNQNLKDYFKKSNISNKDCEDIANNIVDSFKNLKKAGY